MNNTVLELCELLSTQETLRAKQRQLRISYLSKKGKIATKYLQLRASTSDEVHKVMRRIAVLSLTLAR
jgi:hypothetical protein